MNQTTSSTHHSPERSHSSREWTLQARRHDLYQDVQYLHAIAVHNDPALWVEEPKREPAPNPAGARMELQKTSLEAQAGAAVNLSMNDAPVRPQTSTPAANAIINQVSQEDGVTAARQAVEEAQSAEGVF